MKSSAWGRQSTKVGEWFAKFASQLCIIVTVLIALLVGVVSGLFGPYTLAIVIGVLIMAVIIILRQNELAAAVRSPETHLR